MGSSKPAALTVREPTQQRGSDRIERICVAASELLNALDQGEPSVSQIARTAGLSVGSFYHFLPSKEALYLELRRRFFEEIAAMVMPRLSDDAINDLDGFFDALSAAITDLFELTRTHRGLYRVIAANAHASAEFALEVRRQEKPTLDLMASLIREYAPRLRPVEPEKTAALIFLLLEGVMSNWVRHPLPPEETRVVVEGGVHFIAHTLFADEQLARTKRFGTLAGRRRQPSEEIE